MLLYVAVKRHELRHRWIFVTFVASIVVTVAADFLGDWYLSPVSSGLVIWLQAWSFIVSLATVVLLLALVPRLRRLPSEAEFVRIHLDMDRAQALAHFGTWSWDPASDTVRWSSELARIFGLTPDAVPTTFSGYLTLVHPEDRDRSEATIRDACENKASFSLDERIIRPDGETRFLRSVGSVAVDARGKITSLTGVCQDVTASHQQEALFRGLMDSAPDATVVVDPAGRIVVVNDQTETLFGYAREELLGQPVELLVPERFSEHRDHRDIYARAPKPRRMGAGLDLFARRKDGTEFEVEVGLSPLDGSEGPLIISTIRNVSDRKSAERALRENAAQLDAAQRLGHIGSWFWNVETDTVSCSREFDRIFERPIDAKPLTSETVSAAFHADDREALRNAVVSAAKGEQGWSRQARLVTLGGDIRVLKTEGFPIIEGTRVTGVIGTVQDVTEQVTAGEARRASEERFRRAFEDGPLGMVILNRDGTIAQINRACCDMLGRTSGDLVGAAFGSIMHPQDRPNNEMLLTRLFETDMVSCQLETRFLTRTGSVEWVTLALTTLRDHAGQPGHALGMALSITARKNADAAVDRITEERNLRQARLEHLSRRMVEVQEEERRALARELHDEVGQVLTSAKLTLESHRTEGTPERIDRVRGMLDDLVAIVRRRSMMLRPPMLDDMGLLPTLLWLVDSVNEAAGAQVVFRHTGLNRRFGVEIETAVYRIIQEGLTNVVRHSGAVDAEVAVMADDDDVRLIVSDAGSGFDISETEARYASSGLLNMRERAELLGGEFTIESGPDGTRVFASLPIGVSPRG